MNRRDFVKAVSFLAVFGGSILEAFAKRPASRVVVVTSGVNMGAYQCYVAATKKVMPGVLSILLEDG